MTHNDPQWATRWATVKSKEQQEDKISCNNPNSSTISYKE